MHGPFQSMNAVHYTRHYLIW